MTVPVAIIGHGFMGATHAQGYAGLGARATVRYVVDINRDRAAILAERIGAEATDRLDDVLEDHEILAVDICVPTYLHAEIATRALEAGKHVLLEKPIALNLDEAAAIVEAAAESAGLLMVGMVLRFWPEYVALHRAVSEGSIGEPRAFVSSRLSFPADWNTWMADPAKSGGMVVDLLVHDIDQALALLGPARSVSARSLLGPAHAVLIIEHDDGRISNLEGSMSMPRAFPFSSLVRVYGTAGAAEYAFRVGTASEGGNLGEAARPTGLQLFVGTGEVRSVTVEPVDPFRAEIDAFISLVERGERPTIATAGQARDALAVSIAAVRSMENSGRPEDVD